MELWRRWREPLAVVLLTALALMLVVRALAFALAYQAGNAGGLVGSIPGGDDLLLLASAGAVLWCATPVGPDHSLSRHALPLAVSGLVIVGLTVLGWLVLGLWNVVALVSWPTPDLGFGLLVVEGLLRLAVPVTSLVAVVLAVRRAAADRRAGSREESAATAEAPASEVTEEVTDGADTPGGGEPERLPAAWHADEAAGAVWLTADDAAQGRPGLSWPGSGANGELTGGWAAAPSADARAAVPTSEPAEEQAARDAVPPPPRPPSAADDDDLH